ncbi:sporulation protein YpjB [Paenibacillus sp. M1]|uniref:Sporulation protein YpjB n=1 Tax=Paenibacillus haidiansis TaxID=1574488 RepID=A0ABU7VKN9_9BACL
MKAAKWKRVKTVLLCLLALPAVLSQGPAEQAEAAASVPAQEAVKQPERERAEKLASFEQAAEDLYRAMQEGKTQEAHWDMDRLTENLEGLSFKGLTSVEGIHALAESIMDVRESLVRAEVSPEEWAESSAKLRLAVNSLVHKDKALWLQYYKIMSDDLANMSKGRAEGSRTLLREAFLALKSHYEVIRPAAVIDKNPSEINRLDSWMSYADRLSSDSTWDEPAISGAIEQGDRLIKELFGRRGDEPVFLPVGSIGNPWQWGLLIGGWILLALAYTGLRKYRADQSVTSVHAKRDRADSYRF